MILCSSTKSNITKFSHVKTPLILYHVPAATSLGCADPTVVSNLVGRHPLQCICHSSALMVTISDKMDSSTGGV